MKIKGNKKDNTLVGSDENDKIQGLGGDDTITAKGGHDTVDGGAGNDKITIAADSSANIDAGKGNDSVKVSAGALGSDIGLGNGNDSVDFKESSQSNQSFSVDGGKGDDSVNFALDQDAYTVTENGGESYTVVDANGNSYALSSISSLTFNGIAFQPGNPENQAPIVSSPIADQTFDENTAFSFQFATNAFTDADNDPLIYTATLADGAALPSWLVFDAASRTFTGTSPNGTAAVSVNVTASDGVDSISDTFNININDVPTFHERWVAADAAYTAVQQQPNGNLALFGGYTDSTPYNGTTLGQAALSANNTFLSLAKAYIGYLENGGEALTDIIVKSGSGRSQSLHDNILGNVANSSLTDRHLNTADNLARFADWVDRGWVSGYTDANGTAATLKGVAFDFAHDINRDDYRSFDREESDAALTAEQKDNVGGPNTLLNNGTPAEHFHVTTFNAAGISMGLAAHKYGSVYTNYVNGDDYTVDDGRSSINANRADWSFAMSVQDGLNGSTLDIGDASVKGDYDVALWIDTNISGGAGGESFQFIANLEELADSVTSNGNIFQNSWNFDFNEIKPFLDPDYTDDFVGAATFGIELRLTEVGTGNVVMTNHIDVLVV